MLLQAQGNGDSPAGHRLQRLCTELVSHAANAAACQSAMGAPNNYGVLPCN